VQLVSGNPDLMTLADSAFDALEPIRRMAFGEGEPVNHASKEDEFPELGEHETNFESAVKKFINAARAQLLPADLS